MVESIGMRYHMWHKWHNWVSVYTWDILNLPLDDLSSHLKYLTNKQTNKQTTTSYKSAVYHTANQIIFENTYPAMIGSTDDRGNKVLTGISNNLKISSVEVV